MEKITVNKMQLAVRVRQAAKKLVGLNYQSQCASMPPFQAVAIPTLGIYAIFIGCYLPFFRRQHLPQPYTMILCVLSCNLASIDRQSILPDSIDSLHGQSWVIG